MDGVLDARTWLTIVAVVVGFFLVPFAMLAYDHRRQRRLRPLEQPEIAVPERVRPKPTDIDLPSGKR